MSEPELIQPDLSYREKLMTFGAEDLIKCFQCATCSVTCELSPEESPFPRKEMIWAQWGLKERLLADPDIWLCHHCNECSVKCPRGARPGDLAASVRRSAIEHYAIPRFLAEWVNRPSFFPLLLLIPAILLVLALVVRDPLGNLLGFSAHHSTQMEYANLFPHWLIIGFFSFFLTLSVVLVMIGAVRYWKAMKAQDRKEGRSPGGKGVLASATSVLTDIFTHRRFDTCPTNPSRRQAHLYGFYGFLILFLVSAWAVVLLYLLNPQMEVPFEYPFGFWNPAKIIANLGAVALVFGVLVAILARFKAEQRAGRSTEYDWLFLFVLLTVGVTGILTETLRYLSEVNLGYAVYFIHLVFVFSLLIYLPYSKFAHIVYRTVAFIYAEYSGRTSQKPTSSSAQVSTA